MEIVNPGYKIETEIDGEAILKRLEKSARTCYKSENKIYDGSAHKLLRQILAGGHESVIEHENITVRFICDRGVSHELVRHRLAAYSQESTRYCDYNKKGIQVIKPCFWQDDFRFQMWKRHMEECESVYDCLRTMGASPQEARCVLPNSLKTEIVMTTNIREWRHVLKLRTSSKAHPQMRELMIPLLHELQSKIPLLFEDIEEL